jgi:hypothetical protein
MKLVTKYPPSHELPEVKQELIDHLDHIFPVNVDPGYELRNYHFMVGQQMVIDHLKSLLKTEKVR